MRLFPLIALTATCVWSGPAASWIYAVPVSERWCGRQAKAAHAGTLKIEKSGQSLRLVFDLSALSPQATIDRAWLNLHKDGAQPRDPIQVRAATAAGQPEGKLLELEAPWYRRFDATEVLRRWVRQEQANLGFAVAPFEGFRPEESSLEILYEGSPRDVPPQVEGLRAIHHDGQTFLVWTEHAAYRPKPDEVIWVKRFSERGDTLADGPGEGAHGMPNHPAITLRALRRLQGLGVREKPSGFQGIKSLRRVAELEPVAYRVYRHTERITPENIRQAQWLATVDPLAGFDVDVYRTHFKGEYLDQREEPSSPIFTYCPRQGEPLQPGQALYVHTPRRAGRAFYAVTMAVAGTENLPQLTAGNSLASAVEESPASPLPVLQYIQDDTYNADPLEYWYRFWAAPPLVNLPSRSYRVGIAVSEKVQGPRPLLVEPINDTFNVREAIRVPRRDRIHFAVENPLPWMPELFYNEGRDTLRGASRCKVDYFAERYMDYLIKWLMRKHEVDLSRTVGGMLYFGLRHPEIFPRMSLGSYTATYDYRWAPGDPDHLGPKGIKTVQGEDAWDMYSVGGYVLTYPDRDIPFLFCISATGKDSGHTSEFGWQDDPRGWAALRQARAPMVATWSAGLPHELARALEEIRWDASLPAFSNCSLDNNPGNGDPADGDYYGQINAWLLWGDQDQVDEPGRWEMAVFLIESCPQDHCTVDVTPRHCRKFKPRAGDRFRWQLAESGRVMASGQVAADRWGLVTLVQLPVTKSIRRIILERAP